MEQSVPGSRHALHMLLIRIACINLKVCAREARMLGFVHLFF